MIPRCLRFPFLFLPATLVFGVVLSHSEQPTGVQGQALAALVVEGLGRGTVALDGPWQFHTGDDPA
jgi:hypothetical protein